MSRLTVQKAGEEVFRLIEGDQGYAFLSDGIGCLPTKDRLFSEVRASLKHHKICVRKLTAWLKRYDQL